MSNPATGPAPVPEIRIRRLHERPVREDGDYILYWMTAHRRATHNFALDHAVASAHRRNKPLLILEALRVGYRHASDRIHRFVLDGMADNQKVFADKPVLHYPYVEPTVDAGKGLLKSLAARACLVVADDYPCFMLPAMTKAAAAQCEVAFELVDGNGMLPMRAADKDYDRAYLFRRFLQKALPRHLRHVPSADPFAGIDLPRLATPGAQITSRWPAASRALLAGDAGALAALPIDHQVPPVETVQGGAGAGRATLHAFLAERLQHYAEERNQPDIAAQSHLSAYLHFGHVGTHQVFAAVADHQRWTADRLAGAVTGSARGWFGMSADAESFLDELITWRELGFHTCVRRQDHDQLSSLPAFAQKALDEHRNDPRSHVYPLEEFAAAATHDPLWNAAQRQLLREGRIHNYLRMLWGKKILEWSASPEHALAIMIELNNRYALDGRDPNSYTGILWCLGRHDRPWAPRRPVFGTIRYMSSENTARKLRVKGYLERYAP